MLKRLLGNRTNSIKQFPLAHFILFFLTTIIIFEIFDSVENYKEICIASSFTLLLSLYVPIYNILKGNSGNKKLNRASTIISLLVGIGYFFIILNKDIDTTDEMLLYFGIFQIITIGLLLLPFLSTNKDEQKSLYSITNFFIACFFGVLAGLIVRGGISSLMRSIEILFDIDIRRHRYDSIGVISMILLNGSFGLNYYTDQMNSYEKNKSEKQSRIKRIFGNYIYLPLCILYGIILLCFCIKSLFLTTRPKDQILIFVGFGYFLLGLSSTFLTYFEESNTLKKIHNYLYGSFIAVGIFMLFNCIHDAQKDGLHLGTYFMFSGILIILITSTLALFTKKRLLNFVSALLGISFISIYLYPLNAVTVSRNLQINKLKYLITNYQEGIKLPLTEGSLKNCKKHCDEILDILEDLSRNFRYNSRNNGIITGLNEKDPYRRSINDYLFGNEYKDPHQKEYFSLYSSIDSRIDTKDYIRIKPLNKYNYEGIYSIIIEGNKFDISKSKKFLYKASKDNNKEHIIINDGNYDLIITTINGYTTNTKENEITDNNITITDLDGRIAEKKQN